MSALLVCPQCDRKLKIPDTAIGKSIRCPVCKALIPAAKQITAEGAEKPPSRPVEMEGVTSNPTPPPAVLPVRKRPSFSDAETHDPALDVRKPARRGSSLGLILGLVVGGGVFVACLLGGGLGLLAYFLSNKTIPDSEWRSFSPPGSSCTVLMPGIPVPQTKPFPGFTLTQYIVERNKGNIAFDVGFFDVPPQNLRATILEEMTTASSEAIRAKLNGGMVTSNTAISLGNMPGREYQVKGARRGTYIGRLYLANLGGIYRVYILIAGGDTIQPNKGDAARFFDSFQVTAPVTAPNLGGAPVVQVPQRPAANPPQANPPPQPKPSQPKAPAGERTVWQDETSGTQTLALAFSPDGATLAVGHWDKKLRLWDVNGGKERKRIPVTGAVVSVAFSRDGKRLVFGTDNGDLSTAIIPVWDVSLVNAPELKHEIRMAHTRHKAWAKALCFSADGKYLAVALVPDNHSPSEVVLWNLETNKFQASLSDCKEDVKKLAFTDDGSVVILMPSSVRVWDPKANQIRREFKGANPAEQFVTTTVSSDGQTLATMCRDNKVRLWRLADGALQKTWPVTLDLIRMEGCAFAFSPDGKYLAMRGQGSRFHVWNAQTGKALRLAKGGGDFENIDVMTFSPNGRLLAFHGNHGPRIMEVAALLAGN